MASFINTKGGDIDGQIKKNLVSIVRPTNVFKFYVTHSEEVSIQANSPDEAFMKLGKGMMKGRFGLIRNFKLKNKAYGVIYIYTNSISKSRELALEHISRIIDLKGDA